MVPVVLNQSAALESGVHINHYRGGACCPFAGTINALAGGVKAEVETHPPTTS